MSGRAILAAAILACGAWANGDRAAAQCGYGGGMGAYGAWDVGRLYGVLADRVPHFAAFPPVYYSVPVARTYGYSPFAYPPGTMTPEVEQSASPQTIVNPYCREAGATAEESATKPAKKDAAAERTTKTSSPIVPLAIVNPYVTAPSLEQRSEGPMLQAAAYLR